MRRQGHNVYVDPGTNPYMSASQLQDQQLQQDQFQGRLEAFTPERDQNPYIASRPEEPWRRDPPPHMLSEGQVVDLSRSYFQGARPEQKMGFDIQGKRDHRSQSLEDGFQDKTLSSYTFESLEQKFLDDIIKLTKEQNDAEDSENARHRETINAINNKYQEQLVVLRAQHASRRDELLRKESNARQHQYQQALIEHFPPGGLPAMDPHYGGRPAPGVVNEAHQAYNANHFAPPRDQPRFHGGVRDHHSFDSRGRPYPGGRAYDTGSLHY